MSAPIGVINDIFFSPRAKQSDIFHQLLAGRVVKLADTQDLGSCAARLVGSNPTSPIFQIRVGGNQGSVRLHGFLRRARRAARRMAATMLSARARPCPAMSKAVP